VSFVPIILTTDKTHLSRSGKMKAWPVYMTVGNLPNTFRLKPAADCARLIALLPVIDGSIYHLP